MKDILLDICSKLCPQSGAGDERQRHLLLTTEKLPVKVNVYVRCVCEVRQARKDARGRRWGMYVYV